MESNPEEKIKKLEFTVKTLQDSIVVLINKEHEKHILHNQAIQEFCEEKRKYIQQIENLELKIKELSAKI